MKKSNKVTLLRSSGGLTSPARAASAASPHSDRRPAAAPPDSRASSEAVERASRQRFTAEYKHRVLREASAATSHVEKAPLTSQQRGSKRVPLDPRDKRIAELERENARLDRRSARAEAVVEVQ